MADVLSQSEVDALLAAVSTSTGTSADPGTPGHAEAGGRAEFYDFLRPERLSAGEVRALVELHEVAARAIASSLSASVCQPVQCRLQSIDQISWGELILGLPNPTCFGIAHGAVRSRRGEATAGTLAIELPYSVMFPVINRLLGGAADGAVAEAPSRSLTEIEAHIASGVMEIVLAALESAWRRAGEAALALQHVETNPQLVSVAPTTEMAVLATFDVSLGEGVAGLSHLCIPLGPLGLAMRRLAAGGTLGCVTPDATGGKMLRAVGRAPVTVAAYVPGPRMRLRDIVRLAAGAVIETGVGGVERVAVSVAGTVLHGGTACESNGKRAVRLGGAVPRSTLGGR